MTEDHPVEYAVFEGTIPEGEAKGGRSAEDQLAGGQLNMELHGKNLHGAFALVGMGHQSGTLREDDDVSSLQPVRPLFWSEPRLWEIDPMAREAISFRGRCA